MTSHTTSTAATTAIAAARVRRRTGFIDARYNAYVTMSLRTTPTIPAQFPSEEWE